MTSASNVSPPRSDQPRLSLKQPGPSTGFVDGAWWPGSRDLAAELPALAAELGPRLGRVVSISYHLDAWERPPRKVDLHGAAVRLAGYRTQDVDTVDVIGSQGRLTLLVVPPEADPQLARDAMAAAGETGNTDRIHALLHGHQA
jgi:Family of unknown function (DUF5994)